MFKLRSSVFLKCVSDSITAKLRSKVKNCVDIVLSPVCSGPVSVRYDIVNYIFVQT